MKTNILSLYGAPSSGKSTQAARLYSKLKSQGKNAELVREYAKDWAWEQRNIGHFDQIYFFGKQVRRESLLLRKVEWVITDSPVIISLFYARKYCPPKIIAGLESVVKAYYDQVALDGHKHIHVLLERVAPYQPAGRFQTEEQANLIHLEMVEMLNELSVPYKICKGDDESVDILCKDYFDAY